jgi:xanthine dehydrogenase accessory factor
MSNETTMLLGGLRDGWQEGREVALATVVRVIGSAYRRAGAKMLVRSDGGSTCMISGGCLEQEMIEIAMQMLAKGQPGRTVFDYDEEKTWWPGCGGTVEVWVEPVQPGDLITRWLEESQTEPSVLATVIGGGEGRIWVRPDGSAEGQIQPLELQENVIRTARNMLSGKSRPVTRYIQESEVFFDLSSPIPELVIFGAGHDAKPMANQALFLGYRVTVVDARADLLAGFSNCTLIQAAPEEYLAKVALEAKHNVIVMNHHLDIDGKALRFALESPARYVGVLGPSNRLDKILAALELEGFAPSLEQRSRMRNPIGVDIGAESPEEIALATMAEIVGLQRGYLGGYLQGKPSGIHEAVTLVIGQTQQ